MKGISRQEIGWSVVPTDERVVAEAPIKSTHHTRDPMVVMNGIPDTSTPTAESRSTEIPRRDQGPEERVIQAVGSGQSVWRG